MKKTTATLLVLAAAIAIFCIGKSDLHASGSDLPELKACRVGLPIHYSGACRYCSCRSYQAADPRYTICVCGHSLAIH